MQAGHPIPKGPWPDSCDAGCPVGATGGGAGGEVGDRGKQIICFKSATVLCNGRWIYGRMHSSITLSLIRTHRSGECNAPWGLKIHPNTTTPRLRNPNSIPIKRQIEEVQANHKEERSRKKAKKQAKQAANPFGSTGREEKLQAERERTIS